MAAVALPQKRYYRQRAHSNPLSDHDFDYPTSPEEMDWTPYYGEFLQKYQSDENVLKNVEFLDVGCGYGGLLISLSPLYPEKLMLGMEIRVKVADFVQDRIQALRQQEPGQYLNVACLRTNAMKYLPNYFHKHQLSKMFFLYPDPHFKQKKHKWRIITSNLLAEYAYFLRPGGILYTITDVEEIHDWMYAHLNGHSLFERIPNDEAEKEDPVVKYLYESTEEGQKVSRAKGQKYMAIFRRIDDPFTSKRKES